MSKNNSLNLVALVLIIGPLFLILYRLIKNDPASTLGADHQYKVTYQFECKPKENYKVTTYLPYSNFRQQITHETKASEGAIFLKENNKLIQWNGKEADPFTITYQFAFQGKALSYTIDPEISYKHQGGPHTIATSYIESEHPEIRALARNLKSGNQSLVGIIQSLYDYVLAIPSSSESELTSALEAYQKQEASCNGKSRLLVALCRSIGIPARVAGGLILEETSKRTSHLWTEVLIDGNWVPFDALNGHFASLPDYYLELYKGDHFLIKRNRSLEFDYLYVIEKERVNDYPVLAALNVWELIDEAQIPVDMFKMLLLLPLGALLVAISKNIIGLKTYGVFLPVLISLSLLETGLVTGLLLFTSLIGIVALVNFPLEKWGIQYNSKITLMLIAVVVSALLAVQVLHQTGWLDASAPLFFPIIILTIVSERVARKIEEEGLKSSVELYGSTLLVTVFIYFILSSSSIQLFILTFPEIILSIAGINLLLGKWIGLRVTEYYRFYKLADS